MVLLYSKKNHEAQTGDPKPEKHRQKWRCFLQKEREKWIEKDIFCLHIQKFITYMERSRMQLTKLKELEKAGIVKCVNIVKTKDV